VWSSCSLIGPTQDETDSSELLELIRRLAGSHNREQAVVNVIEDAHWIDPASDEFLACLVEATGRARNLVVVTFRPEYAADWMRRSWYRQLPLSPLPPAVVATLLGELLGTDPSLDGLADLLRANARALLLAVGWRISADLDRMREVFDESVAAATRARDDRLLAQVQIPYIAYLGATGGQFDEVAELATDCLQTVRRSGDLDLVAVVQVVAAYASCHAGRFPEALEAAEAGA
jgi:hypothetical protein